MDNLHERVAGLDVHKHTVVACVRLREAYRLRRDCQTFAATTDVLRTLTAWLSRERCMHVAMEATGVHCLPVWKILGAGDFDLVVDKAAHIKNFPGRKTDMNDAMWITDLLACGLIKASFVPSEDMRELRSLTRTHKQRVRVQRRTCSGYRRRWQKPIFGSSRSSATSWGRAGGGSTKRRCDTGMVG